jgi:serine/threonine protein phosphatase 1
MADRQKFAKLRACRRVWAVGAIHGEAGRLESLHRALWPRLKDGDRIVYLGNMIGRGSAIRQTVDSLLTFRRAMLSRPNTFVCDLVYLRGSQEEMWQKLLQLQFATDPRAVLAWMLDQGVGATLESYGGTVESAHREVSVGTLGLTRWTGGLREAMQRNPGHYQLFGALRRAAFTDDGSLLFVNAGLDPTRPLEAQSDSFWWSGGAFSRMAGAYGGYRRVVRGFDPNHGGFAMTDYTATIDGGCGFDGPLLAACFTASGELVEQVEG